MSQRPFTHWHRTAMPGQVVVHGPDGALRGYIQRVRVRGQSRPGFIPCDADLRPLGQYDDTFDRALDNVCEQ